MYTEHWILEWMRIGMGILGGTGMIDGKWREGEEGVEYWKRRRRRREDRRDGEWEDKEEEDWEWEEKEEKRTEEEGRREEDRRV